MAEAVAQHRLGMPAVADPPLEIRTPTRTEQQHEHVRGCPGEQDVVQRADVLV